MINIDEYYFKNYFNRKYNEINAILLSKGETGKTCIFNRFIMNEFTKKTLATFGMDYGTLYYEYQTDLYKLKLWETSGYERLRELANKKIKNSDITIIVFDLSENNSIDYDRINEINELNNSIISKKKLIYLVGNKLDISQDYLQEYRKISDNLIKDGKIYKYFEISTKTGEGFDNF